MELPLRQGQFSIGSSIAPGDTSLPPKIGGYKVLRRLATGGTSDVLLARADGKSVELPAERIVVLKLLLRQYREDPAFERMFAREARAYSRLSHPAIVKLYDFFADSGQLVMVLEYVDGFPLHKLRALLKVRGQQLDARASAFLASRIFSALSAAHTARDPQSGEIAPVIHRDVNPSNVLVPWDGLAKIADFGIAKVTGVDGESQAGFIKGTYGYMAPEQVRGEEVTARADVYAGCLLLWELLAGRKAILRGSSSDVEVLKAMAEPKIPPLSTLRPDLPKPLLDAVIAGLEPDPKRRAITADEVFQTLGTSMNLEEGRAALVEALAGVRPPAPIDESVTPPPPLMAPAFVGTGSADATIPNPLAVQKALASSNAEAIIERRSQSTKPVAFKGGTLVMSQSPVAVPSPPRPPLTRAPPRPNAAAPAPHVAAPSAAPPPPPATPAASPPSQPLPQPPSPADVAFLPGPWAPEAPPPPGISPLAATFSASDPFPSVRPAAPIAAPSPPAPAPTPVPEPPPPARSPAMLPPKHSSPVAVAPAPGAPVVLPRTGRRRRRSRWTLLVGVVVILVGGGIGVVAGLMQQPSSDVHSTPPAASSATTTTTTASAAAAVSETATTPSVATSAAAATAATIATPAVTTATAATPSVATTASAEPSSSSSPEMAPIASNMGRITVAADRGGHRVWVDKHIVGESPGSFDVPCGSHTVQVGSAGTVQKVDVACGVETEVR